jgi:hypothetical protein
MQFHRFDQPVINLHELTNGLWKFYSPDFNREMLSHRGKYGYHQTLPDVIELLDSVDHYKTARLAQYHIVQRQDSLADQLPFYQYLNENFYVIACRRENLFEHALSHAFNSVTKRLNVYHAMEKIESFYRLYRSGIEVQDEHMFLALDRYKDYLTWADRYFSVGSYFVYEKHLPIMEKYILGLPVFGEQPQLISWQQNFHIDFEHWNRCHYYNSDLGALALGNHLPLLENHVTTKLIQSSALAVLKSALPSTHQAFLSQYHDQYAKVQQSINKMQRLGILHTGVPIKKQTLLEKLHMIKNLDQCVQAFNIWVEHNPGITLPVDLDHIRQQAEKEYQVWDSRNQLTGPQLVQLPTVK